MKKIFICGLPASGKGLMKQLLDGHSKLCIIPIQGFILKKLVSYNLDSTMSGLKLSNPYRKKIYEQMPFFNIVNADRTYRIDFDEFIRNIYHNVDLYTASRSKKLWAAAGEGTATSVEFVFDYFRHEEELFESLFSRQATVSLDEFIDISYKTFINNWKNKNINIENIEGVFATVQNGIEPISWLLKNTASSKLLLMDRDGIGFSYALAKKRAHRHKQNGFYSELYNYSVINSLKEYKRIITSREISSNPRVLVVDFDKLVLDTRNTMQKVAAFLNIGYEDIMTTATLNKTPLESDKVKFTKKINDDPLANLPSSAVELLRHLYYGPGKQSSRWKQCALGLRGFKHKYSQRYYHYRQLCEKLLKSVKN